MDEGQRREGGYPPLWGHPRLYQWGRAIPWGERTVVEGQMRPQVADPLFREESACAHHDPALGQDVSGWQCQTGDVTLCPRVAVIRARTGL